MSEEKKQPEAPKKVMPKPGDLLLVKVRARIIDVGPEMTQVDLEELTQYGVVDRPVFLWCPTGMIIQEIIPLQAVEFDAKEGKADLQDIPTLAADLRETPEET